MDQKGFGFGADNKRVSGQVSADVKVVYPYYYRGFPCNTGTPGCAPMLRNRETEVEQRIKDSPLHLSLQEIRSVER